MCYGIFLSLEVRWSVMYVLHRMPFFGHACCFRNTQNTRKKWKRKKTEEMKTWMRKPKKALDTYRLAISTILTFIPAVLLVALCSIIMIKLKKQAHPGEQSANAEEQRTRRNRKVLKMAIAIVLAFFRWTPYVINELISLCLLTGITYSCSSDIYTYLSSILISAYCVINPIICFSFSSNSSQSFLLQ